MCRIKVCCECTEKKKPKAEVRTSSLGCCFYHHSELREVFFTAFGMTSGTGENLRLMPQDVYEKESQQVTALPYRRPQFQKLELSISLSQTATEVKVFQRCGFLNSQYMTDDGQWTAKAVALMPGT